jgi:hypothetical protein
MPMADRFCPNFEFSSFHDIFGFVHDANRAPAPPRAAVDCDNRPASSTRFGKQSSVNESRSLTISPQSRPVVIAFVPFTPRTFTAKTARHRATRHDAEQATSGSQMHEDSRGRARPSKLACPKPHRINVEKVCCYSVSVLIMAGLTNSASHLSSRELAPAPCPTLYLFGIAQLERPESPEHSQSIHYCQPYESPSTADTPRRSSGQCHRHAISTMACGSISIQLITPT